MIFYLCPGSPQTLSGGTRKLYDHVAILSAHGFQAKIIYNHEVNEIKFTPDDIVVIPEVYGDGLREFPPGPRKISFVQNGYLIDEFGVKERFRHPFVTTMGLIAIFTESEHTEYLIGKRFPGVKLPLIRTHSSGNGRNGQDAGFSYGEWPREKSVVYFDYKHEDDNAKLFADLELPDGWTASTLTGSTDAQVQDRLRTSAIFAAANTREGMCAPTAEAIISGAVNVCWPGGPKGQTVVGGPMEYLTGRAVIAPQGDLEALRNAITDTAFDIEADPYPWGVRTREWSDWYQATYSRQAEIDEICQIFEGFGAR